jgi:protein-S-isoprenylcysteine O-methyltransferase Ste14
MIEEKKFIAEEHPKGDKYQIIMLGIFLVVWIIDSFIFKVSLIDFTTPWYLTGALGTLILLTGVYLVNESHKLVIEIEEPEFIDWGVYSLARHPMYFGIMLVYLGLTISTVSWASLLVLIGIAYIYDQIADYEENQLIEKIGKKYIDYCGKTRRWLIL